MIIYEPSSIASTRRLTFAAVKSNNSGTTGVPDTDPQSVGTAAAAAEPARRKAVSVKVSCSRESAQVEHARTCILLNDVCVFVSLVFYFCHN